MTPRQLDNRITGWLEVDEIRRRNVAEMARTMAWFILQPHMKKGANITPQELWPMGFDPVDEQEEELPEQRAKRLYLAKKAMPPSVKFSASKEADIAKYYTSDWDA